MLLRVSQATATLPTGIGVPPRSRRDTDAVSTPTAGSATVIARPAPSSSQATVSPGPVIGRPAPCPAATGVPYAAALYEMPASVTVPTTTVYRRSLVSPPIAQERAAPGSQLIAAFADPVNASAPYPVTAAAPCSA